MDKNESLCHTKAECKCHVVFIPKCRRRVLYTELRPYLGEVLRSLALQKESRIEEGHLMSDHVHLLIEIPPKYAVSQVIGYIKGKSAIHLARVYGERKRNFTGQHFWARGYFVTIPFNLRRYLPTLSRSDFMEFWENFCFQTLGVRSTTSLAGCWLMRCSTSTR